MAIFLVLFVLLASGGVAAYLYFTKPAIEEPVVLNPRPKPPVPAEVKAPVTPPPPAAQTPPVNPVIAEKPPAEVAAATSSGPIAVPSQPAPSTPPVVANPPAAPVQPAPEPAPVAAPKRPEPSTRFVRFADALKISGVFQGNPARALVDGRLVREGEMVDLALGIRFAGVEADTKYIILEDATTAQIRVKY